MKICSSAYANNWWDNSKDFKHALLIIMARAQWPLILIVGNVMELSLQNFVLVCIYIYIYNDFIFFFLFINVIF